MASEGPVCAHHQICSFGCRAGFEKPSAIQQKGIVPFGKGHDVIQQAQSGTGKTATFCAGVLQSLDFNMQECQALILAPTRELAQQIEKVMRALGDYLQVPRSRTPSIPSHLGSSGAYPLVIYGCSLSWLAYPT